uniref:YheV family putative zinc ribbon protein n=1 Tax=Ningiella ruwaisensis TaxID=2364274 RepID=UPI00109F9C6F|nr:YheV family putative zinc ribbon protein [Ningiella ruwaisensis]
MAKSTHSKSKKRFIAGATCPKCKSMDTLMLYFENNVEKLACVNCDYAESQTDEKVASASKSKAGVIGVFKP